MINIRYGFANLKDIKVHKTLEEKTPTKEKIVIELEGKPCLPTTRFWRSFFNRYRISDSVFRYFSHEEVFQRISTTIRADDFRYCVEEREGGASTLLAVSNPERTVIRSATVETIVQSYGSLGTEYHEGFVTSTHSPRSGEFRYKIGPDEFQNQYVIKTPIDGFGEPQIYLSLLRLICSNGAIGYTPAFRSEIRTGKDPEHAITRALNCFDNAKGYSLMAARFEAAQCSWASLHEIQRVYNQLIKLKFSNPEFGSTALNRLYELTGRPQELYGLANLDQLSEKRQKVLPAKCRVYDLLNFITEIATHHMHHDQALRLHALTGTFLSDDFDLEGSADQVPTFGDLFLAT
jgi:hypothetical protein